MSMLVHFALTGSRFDPSPVGQCPPPASRPVAMLAASFPQAVLPYDERENGDEGDSSNDSTGDGTDIGLAGCRWTCGRVDLAVDRGALIACSRVLDADLVGRTCDALAGQRRLLAQLAALLYPEDVLSVWHHVSMLTCFFARVQIVPLSARIDMTAVVGDG